MWLPLPHQPGSLCRTNRMATRQPDEPHTTSAIRYQASREPLPYGDSDQGLNPLRSRSEAAGQTQAENTGAVAPAAFPTDAAFQQAHTFPQRQPAPPKNGLTLDYRNL
jgi:hypothetical protein